ncbi:hypothetical protein WMY93_022313 [Mugilogobius chulae]|uniref:Secreted protein n=1 Tax=Mugilogobius chulae TaxID=88201 RepID=A0AAW0N6M7_9GOBI
MRWEHILVDERLWLRLGVRGCSMLGVLCARSDPSEQLLKNTNGAVCSGDVALKTNFLTSGWSHFSQTPGEASNTVKSSVQRRVGQSWRDRYRAKAPLQLRTRQKDCGRTVERDW